MWTVFLKKKKQFTSLGLYKGLTFEVSMFQIKDWADLEPKITRKTLHGHNSMEPLLCRQWYHWKFLATWGKASSPFVSAMWQVSGLLDKNHKNGIFFILTNLEESLITYS